MSEEIKEILWDCEKQLNEASGYNNTTNKILDYIERLESQLQQKENIIKEVREYIMTELITEWDIKHCGCVSGSDLPVEAITPILEMLDKEIKQ